MSDIVSCIADPDDLRFFTMLAIVLAAGVLAVAAGAQMLPRREDGGFDVRARR